MTSAAPHSPGAPEAPGGDRTPEAGQPQHRPSGPRWGGRTTTLVLAAGAIVLLLVGATIGMALKPGTSTDAVSVPASDSVDAGFARDMIVHHTQGALMAHYAQENTDDPEIAVMGYDIDATQTAQLGQMQGWLALWQLPQVTGEPPMAWMGSDGHAHGSGTGATASAPATGSDGAIMPGMATNAEIAQLRDARGEASDVLFLQLMIRHHQGGVPMMQEAADHAGNPIVRNFAGKMLETQQSEIAVMTQMLQQRGAEPLPAS
ncbi:DUF305 domain-containing protein [Nakamurella leprariae]|uniref:DUF305 domain-containing protein n=1 Tax=Nakamurella leprariae TaxID=2803911 RepID=A0A939BX95_9ACTN|nr:DUF305 domain-containing protein [Nakamurella leprariae]MBM9465745.1 DUF305 domain-containing protein [Nakamurella leprariae]